MAPSSEAGPSNGPETSHGNGPIRVGTWRDDQPSSKDPEVELVWKQRNLLSLDGGGIRGYWSLLVLRRLMKAIADEERAQASTSQLEVHSFWPLQFPEDVTQGPYEPEEIEELRAAEQENGKSSVHAALRDPRKFLPCHYFDVICGSSTGSLIALMLCRFRMTVQDCLNEYERMGNVIFGNPRPISQRNIGIVRWPKYSASAMETAFRDVTARRCGRDENVHATGVTLPTISGTCKMFVTTMQKKKGSEASEDTLYLIRSYHHFQKPQNGRSERRNADVSKRNWGKRSELEIWQVARAATAAPFYFKEIKFNQENEYGLTKVYFSDGGFGHTNNPTMLGIQEIEGMYGRNNIGVVASIGTARADNASTGKSFLKRVAKSFNEATDPKIVAAFVAREELDFYYRFNDSKGIPLDLDDWKPNGWFTQHPGRKTLREIEDHFNKWVARRSVLADFKSCAEELVRRRRRRVADESRWERYATGAQYRCQHAECNRFYGYREYFEEHWLKTHTSHDSAESNAQPTCKVEPWKYRPERSTLR